MSILVPITLYGWIFVAIALFAVLPPRRAVLAAYLLAWLFLPQAAIPFKGFPDLDKISATGLGALIGVVMFDAGRLLQFRLSWVDLPIIIWCLSPLPSSLANELPPGATSTLYDGLSGVFKDTLLWGIPYFVGRLYFNDLASLRELAIGLFGGGLLYLPLCAYELKMSPHLHQMVYGFHPSDFLMTIRFGGWRPMVFMQHGLMVGMWMTSASLAGIWLWRTGALQKVWHIPIAMLVLPLVVITVMCKSTGAIVLLMLGFGILLVNQLVKSNAFLILALSLTPVYMLVRAEGWWSGSQLVDVARHINDERADSIEGRLENEDMLIEKASAKPWFGWGGWGGWRVYDPDTGEDITVSDGMWVIARGERGMVGLASFTLAILLPFALLLRRIPARYWATPLGGPPAVLAILLLLYSIDNLFNAMLNPIYLLAAGGISGFYLAAPQLFRAMAHASAARVHRARQWRVSPA